MRQGKYLPAVVLFSESIKLDPANAVTYLDRGSARKALGEVDLAMSDFNTAITLRPGLAEDWYYRGATLANLDRYDRALGDLSEAIRLKPDFALAYADGVWPNSTRTKSARLSWILLLELTATLNWLPATLIEEPSLC